MFLSCGSKTSSGVTLGSNSQPFAVCLLCQPNIFIQYNDDIVINTIWLTYCVVRFSDFMSLTVCVQHPHTVNGTLASVLGSPDLAFFDSHTPASPCIPSTCAGPLFSLPLCPADSGPFPREHPLPPLSAVQSPLTELSPDGNRERKQLSAALSQPPRNSFPAARQLLASPGPWRPRCPSSGGAEVKASRRTPQTNGLSVLGQCSEIGDAGGGCRAEAEVSGLSGYSERFSQALREKQRWPG